MPAGNSKSIPGPDAQSTRLCRTANHESRALLDFELATYGLEILDFVALPRGSASFWMKSAHLTASDPIRISLLAYAAAVSATAFGTAAAEAEIHYSGVVDKKLVNPHGGTSARFRLSNGAYISLYNISYGRRGYNYVGFRLRGAAVSHGFRASAGPPYFGVGASRLHSGEPVSQGIFRATYPSSTVGNIRSFYGGGNWDAGGRGFIGFKFNTGAGPQYGWVECIPARRRWIPCRPTN